MVVFSKQITLLIHIIIHTNGTITKNYFSHHTLEEKKMPALYGAENFFLSLKTCNKKYSSLTKPPPPPPWKSNGRSLSRFGLIHVALCKL